MSNLIATDLQGQEVSSAVITLFELELPDGSFVFFHPGTNSSIGSVQFRNKTTTTPNTCLLYTSPSPRDGLLSRMPSSA